MANNKISRLRVIFIIIIAGILLLSFGLLINYLFEHYPQKNTEVPQEVVPKASIEVEIFQVTSKPSYQVFPVISGNIIVWLEIDPESEPIRYNIVGYDLTTRREFYITNDTRIKAYPRISDNNVIWLQQSVNGGKVSIEGYNLVTQKRQWRKSHPVILFGISSGFQRIFIFTNALTTLLVEYIIPHRVTFALLPKKA